MATISLPPIQPFHPTTFLERGVTVPFTTPLLEGTRARPGEKHGIELVVPNPSGGRGVYILPWAAVGDLCRPTLHDTVMNSRILDLPVVTPVTIRRAARDIALEGLAGEAAAGAAAKAADEDKDGRLIANYLLLVALVEQTNLIPDEREMQPGPVNMEERARMTTAWIAPRLGRSPSWVAEALESLSDVLGGVGVGKGRTTARIPRLLGLLRDTVRQVTDWSGEIPEDDLVAHARMICMVAKVTLGLAEAVLGRAQGLATDMAGLLRDWAANPDTVAGAASRPDWLLDGWEQICLIWKFAPDEAARRAAVVEMSPLVPIIPREANDWCEDPRDSDPSLRFRRLVTLNEDWRSGLAVLDLVARNEQIRAASC